MISAWDVYWVMQLDSIRGLFVGLSVAGLAATILALVFAPFWLDEYCIPPRFRKWIAATVAAPLLLGGVGVAFIPSTQTAAAMIVLPALTSDEVTKPLAKEAGDLYRLAKRALSDAVGDKPEPQE